MAVLYRKYRPQNFGEVLNQKYIIQTLKNQVEGGAVAHAYLFTGSRGVGKTSVARILAKAVNCLQVKNGEPCGQCQICQQIASNSFLDLVEIDAASNTGVDNIRDLIEHVKFSPSIGKYKVFIIDEVHMLSKGAFNALLKTLEEPPKHAIFVLATTEINKVPATIISRTQRFDFRQLDQEDLQNHLKKVAQKEKIVLGDPIFALIAQNAEGSVRDALSLLDKLSTLGDSVSLEDARSLLGVTDISLSERLLEFIALGKSQDIPEFFNSLTERGLDFVIFNRDFLEYLRQALIYKVTQGQLKPLWQKEHLEQLQKLAVVLSPSEIIFIVRLFLKSFKDSGATPSPELPMLLSSIEAALRKGQPVFIAGNSEKVLQQQAPQMPAVKNIDELFQKEAFGIKPDEVTKQEAEQMWPEIIDKLKAVNGPLANLVKNSPLIAAEPGCLILSVKYLFHKQSLEQAKNQQLISGAIKQVCGKNLAVSGQLMKPTQADSKSPAKILSDALQVFGGELIE